jgi:hypothetical protein
MGVIWRNVAKASADHNGPCGFARNARQNAPFAQFGRSVPAQGTAAIMNRGMT